MILGNRFQGCRGSTPEGGTPIYGLYGDVPLNRMCFFFCLSESGTGSTNQHFCPEHGILFAILTLDHGWGSFFAANEHCCRSCLGPAACLLKHAVSDSKVNGISHFSVWNRVSMFTILSGTG